MTPPFFTVKLTSALTGRLGPRFLGEAHERRREHEAPTPPSARGRPDLVWTAAVAVLVAAILVEHARGGELMDCEPQPASGDGRHWAYRIIHGRECWYPGERGKPKLRWTEAPSAPQQSGMLKQSEGEVSLPEPAPQQPGVVERSEVEGSPRKPILDLAAASPEPGIEGMPEEWRAAAADQLLAFTCCWPELPATVPLPQPGSGRTQDQPPAWPLILLPLALCAMWSIRKLKRGA
jgi:hypothetical protein